MSSRSRWSFSDSASYRNPGKGYGSYSSDNASNRSFGSNINYSPAYSYKSGGSDYGSVPPRTYGGYSSVDKPYSRRLSYDRSPRDSGPSYLDLRTSYDPRTPSLERRSSYDPGSRESKRDRRSSYDKDYTIPSLDKRPSYERSSRSYLADLPPKRKHSSYEPPTYLKYNKSYSGSGSDSGSHERRYSTGYHKEQPLIHSSYNPGKISSHDDKSAYFKDEPLENKKTPNSRSSSNHDNQPERTSCDNQVYKNDNSKKIKSQKVPAEYTSDSEIDSDDKKCRISQSGAEIRNRSLSPIKQKSTSSPPFQRKKHDKDTLQLNVYTQTVEDKSNQQPKSDRLRYDSGFKSSGSTGENFVSTSRTPRSSGIYDSDRGTKRDDILVESSRRPRSGYEATVFDEQTEDSLHNLSGPHKNDKSNMAFVNSIDCSLIKRSGLGKENRTENGETGEPLSPEVYEQNNISLVRINELNSPDNASRHLKHSNAEKSFPEIKNDDRQCKKEESQNYHKNSRNEDNFDQERLNLSQSTNENSDESYKKYQRQRCYEDDHTRERRKRDCHLEAENYSAPISPRLTESTLSLAESIEKVNEWKKQLEKEPPSTYLPRSPSPAPSGYSLRSETCSNYTESEEPSEERQYKRRRRKNDDNVIEKSDKSSESFLTDRNNVFSPLPSDSKESLNENLDEQKWNSRHSLPSSRQSNISPEDESFNLSHNKSYRKPEITMPEQINTENKNNDLIVKKKENTTFKS